MDVTVTISVFLRKRRLPTEQTSVEPSIKVWPASITWGAGRLETLLFGRELPQVVRRSTVARRRSQDVRHNIMTPATQTQGGSGLLYRA